MSRMAAVAVMDATAVAAARGLATPNLLPRHFLVAVKFDSSQRNAHLAHTGVAT